MGVLWLANGKAKEANLNRYFGFEGKGSASRRGHFETAGGWRRRCVTLLARPRAMDGSGRGGATCRIGPAGYSTTRSPSPSSEAVGSEPDETRLSEWLALLATVAELIKLSGQRAEGGTAANDLRWVAA